MAIRSAMTASSWIKGWLAPVFLCVVVAGFVPAARAQETPVPPDRSQTAQLVWTTLVAVDHANRTGNFTVLRDLAAPEFRRVNDPARLAAIFATIREQDLGLDRVVLATPVYAEPPGLTKTGLFRIRGSFPARPTGVAFDLHFQHAEGAWKLFGVSIAPTVGDGVSGSENPSDQAAE